MGNSSQSYGASPAIWHNGTCSCGSSYCSNVLITDTEAYQLPTSQVKTQLKIT